MNVIRWQPPWPLIQISDTEWIILRDQAARPAALVRYIKDKPDSPYRVVRWAPDPADRRLFEYFPSLEMADMAVTFIDGEPDTGRTALSSDRSPEWGRFERWYWSQAPERLTRESTPKLGIQGTACAARQLLTLDHARHQETQIKPGPPRSPKPTGGSTLL